MQAAADCCGRIICHRPHGTLDYDPCARTGTMAAIRVLKVLNLSGARYVPALAARSTLSALVGLLGPVETVRVAISRRVDARFSC